MIFEGASQRSPGSDHDVDVLIVGAGIAGTLLATVLARAGLGVLVLEGGQHPRFAIGESTIPHTSTLFRLVAERYDVPEIKHLATFDNVRGHIGATHGIKRGFNFLYHRPGEQQNLGESHQLPIPKLLHTESHFYRQDIDAWLVTLAISYGAVVRQNVRVTDIDLADDAVTVTSDRGRTWRAKFLVDASGFRSPLADKLALREDPCRFLHHSRSMFTHMYGVTPWEKVAPDTPGPIPGSETTLHHVFPGGWIWVIPFNNTARSTNPLVSVGMTVDPRVHPRRDVPPGQEFAEFIAEFPGIARQFRRARPVREWVVAPRLQYSSRATVGHRWALAMHAAGFLDPLFSRGLSFTLDWIHSFAHRLIDAVAEDDFSVERFAYVDRLTQGLLDFNDKLVANAYRSFDSFGMWDAWVRVWALAEQVALFETNRSYARYRNTGDPAVLDRLEEAIPNGSLPAVKEVRDWFAWAYERAAAVRDGEVDPETTGREIIAGMGRAGFSAPQFRITDPSHRAFYAPAHTMPRILDWARHEAHPELGANVTEALALFSRLRVNPAEYDVVEEVKRHAANVPLLSRVLGGRKP